MQEFVLAQFVTQPNLLTRRERVLTYDHRIKVSTLDAMGLINQVSDVGNLKQKSLVAILWRRRPRVGRFPNPHMG